MSAPTQQDQPCSSSLSEFPEELAGSQKPTELAGPEEGEEGCPPTPPSPCSGRPGGHLDTPYLNDLPSLTPSKLATSVSDSDSDLISERFTDDDENEPTGLLDALSLAPSQTAGIDARQPIPPAQRTPSSQTSLGQLSNSHISLSEPAPIRNGKIARKRSLSALVALRYRGGKGDSEIGDEERGLLALDLDTYINSGEPEIPETRALPPSALFPTLSTVLPLPTSGKTGGPMLTSTRRFLASHLSTTVTTENEEEATKEVPQTPALTVTLHPDSLLVPTPRSEWPFGGGTGPGKTSRGFIPGHCLHLFSPTTPTSSASADRASANPHSTSS